VVQEREAPRKGGYRERHRAARRREFLDIARQIVNTESQAALTMQRLAEETGSSAGGPYVYFPSKDALLAELQLEAFDIVLRSYRLGRVHLEEFLAGQGADRADAALTGVLANCVFWVESEETLPQDIELTRRLIGGHTTVEIDPQAGVLPIALEVVEEGRQRIEAAVEAGAIGQGNSVERAIVLVASMTGVALVSKLGDWDNELFDGRRLASSLAEDILDGWGAPRPSLEAAAALLDQFREAHHVAPVVGPADAT
jgi:AcrR family transcriptional regulator